jgi:hypothetical protein
MYAVVFHCRWRNQSNYMLVLDFSKICLFLFVMCEEDIGRGTVDNTSRSYENDYL